MNKMNLHLVGCASGVAGADVRSGDGPLTMQASLLLAELNAAGTPLSWDAMVKPKTVPGQRVDEAVRDLCVELANAVSVLTKEQKFFSVIGGDHSCAIGTWSGVYAAKHVEGDMGLIWIDAHMDSHTPETSESGRIHGMPLATLLGHGYATLTTILNHQPKFKPEHVCLIGVRSYEQGEAELLKRLNVKVFFMDEVKERGFAAVWQDALAIVNRGTIGYGVTLDIDSLDPLDAPGVDVPEPDGIRAADLMTSWKLMAEDPRLIATEIVEFDPSHDQDQKTEKLIVSLLQALALGKYSAQ